MRTLFAAALLLTAAPVLADETTGTVLAYDRKAGVIVLTDKTVFSLELLGNTPVADLVAGDKVKIVYEAAGEDGMTAITAIDRMAE